LPCGAAQAGPKLRPSVVRSRTEIAPNRAISGKTVAEHLKALSTAGIERLPDLD
jgi:2-amino-4-hydroxy-6-hydroxymethyldihydropteridine diphosphokinase